MSTLTVMYNSSKPKSKVRVKIKKTRYHDVLLPGQEKTYSLKPGEYRVKIRIGLLRWYKKWVIIAPSEEPVTIRISFDKGDIEAKIDMIQSYYSESIARFLDEKKTKESNEIINTGKSLADFGLEKTLLLLIVSIIGCVIMTPIAIGTIIRFFILLIFNS